MKRWLLFTLLLTSCHHAKKAPPPVPSFPVKIVTVTETQAPVFVEALGHVESITSVNILSRIEGELTGVYFQQGQEVKKGDLLFTIDPRPYQATLKQNQATLEQNKVNLALAKEKVLRYKILAQDEYYSQIDYETLQTNYASNAALVMESEAAVDSALINLNYCWIYSPIDGVSGILNIDFGNLIAADSGQSLTTVNQIAPIYITYSVPEIYLHEIQKYRKIHPLEVRAAFKDFTQDFYTGTLDIINNQVDMKTGMITLRATYANEDRSLWPGQFIRTRTILYTLPNAIVVPYAAIQLTQSGPIAFVVKPDYTVEQRTVKLGQREDSNIIILEGIKTGEKLVVEGQLNLSPGAKVYTPEEKKS